MKKILFLLAFTSVSLFAADTAFADSDYIPRLVNFFIFAGILYYLLADPAKKFFKERREGIASELERVEEKLKETARSKEKAQEELQRAKQKAQDIIESAKKESSIIKQNYARDLEHELSAIEKQYEDMMTLEKRRGEREVASAIVSEIFDESSKDINKDNYVDIVLKKVA
ncbi:MAG: F0F1 ATP synthase subunit B [Campylobacterales bacterium]